MQAMSFWVTAYWNTRTDRFTSSSANWMLLTGRNEAIDLMSPKDGTHYFGLPGHSSLAQHWSPPQNNKWPTLCPSHCIKNLILRTIAWNLLRKHTYHLPMFIVSYPANTINRHLLHNGHLIAHCLAWIQFNSIRSYDNSDTIVYSAR